MTIKTCHIGNGVFKKFPECYKTPGDGGDIGPFDFTRQP